MAAVTLERNQVLSRHIKDGQVKRPDIAKDAVDGTKVKNQTLQAGDFAPGQIPAGPQGPQGAQGAQGEQGIQGLKGDDGAPGAANPNADFLDGLDSSAFALTGHNHDAAYALTGHNHDAAYVNVGEVDSVNTTMINDRTRRLDIPLASFHDCDTGTGALLDYNSGDDRIADFAGSTTDGQGYAIEFDAAAGFEDESRQVCAEVSRPSDYASGAANFRVTTSKSGNSGAEENISYTITGGGAAPGGGSFVRVDDPDFATRGCACTVFPTAGPLVISLAATSPTTMNDAVKVYAVSIDYTAVS